MEEHDEIEEIITINLGRIYYLLHFLKKARIAETVNEYVPNNEYIVEVAEGKGPVCFTVGQVYEIIVINRLQGLKNAIYHIGEWAGGTAIPEIYGIPADLLNDDRIGRLLDKIYPHLATIDSAITLNIIKAFSINCTQIHFDPSSFEVYGEYMPIAGEKDAIEITYGRNGKGRIDSKQVRVGVAIAEDHGILLRLRLFDPDFPEISGPRFRVSNTRLCLYHRHYSSVERGRAVVLFKFKAGYSKSTLITKLILN